MKAVQINKYGGVEVLEINENAPKPSPSEGQVLVDVHASSINPFDWKVRAGYAKEYMPLEFPVTLGSDFSGVVVEVGPPTGGIVPHFKVGDEVYGQAASWGGGSGSFAQFATASIGKISNKPETVSDEEAAAIPLAGISALQALEEHIKLKSGQKLLINGGAGGIGTFAVQIAKSLGAYVATTVSAKDIEYVEGLGADQAIDYKQSFSSNKNQAFEKILSGFDAVFDTVGGETLDKSFLVLKKGGIIVSMMGEPSVELAKKYGVVAIGQNTDGTTEKLKRLAELADEKKIIVQVDKVFQLNEVKVAFQHLEQGHPRGKVVLKI